MMIATGCLILLVNFGGSMYAWNSSKVLGLIAGIVLGGISFLWVEAKYAEQPILPLSLLKIPTVYISLIGIFCNGAALYTYLAFLPLFYQMVYGDSPTISGLRTIPYMLFMLITVVLVGRYMGQGKQVRWFPAAGFALYIVSAGLFYTIDVHTSYGLVCVFMLVQGIGTGLQSPILPVLAQNASPEIHLATISAVTSFCRTIGAAIGVAVANAIVTYVLQSQMPSDLLPYINENPAVIEAALTAAQWTQFLQVYADALDRAFILTMPFLAAAFIGSLFMPDQNLKGNGNNNHDHNTNQTLNDAI